MPSVDVAKRGTAVLRNVSTKSALVRLQTCEKPILPLAGYLDDGRFTLGVTVPSCHMPAIA